MLAFEALLESGFVPVRSMEFHWYAGEERGLLGSIVMADKYEELGRLPFATYLHKQSRSLRALGTFWESYWPHF